MTWRYYLLLASLGLIVVTIVAAFQAAPGYMDADYYYAGGLQLVGGHGFTEPYLWNYLDNPSGLPHPSNAYWMPLASLLVAAGATLFGPGSWFAARVGFLAVAAAIPPLTAALAWSFTFRRDLALISGLLAVFSAFYLPFLPVTDTFGLYMFLGALFFLVADRRTLVVRSLVLGLISGFMHLARADGLLWLGIALIVALCLLPKSPHRRFLLRFYALLLTLAGYLLVMAPWYARNISAFGSPLAPGGSRMIWLTSYNQLFTYPASQLAFTAWWQSGIAAILKVRLWALGINLERTLAEQGEIFLLPLIGMGLWHLRKNPRVQLAGVAWLLTLGAMTVLFPFAGARGGFFHSGAALQPVWWALAPLGLDRVIEWGKRRRGWNTAQAGIIFRPAMIALAVLLTVSIVWGRLVGGNSAQGLQSGVNLTWSQENIAYSHIHIFLAEHGATTKDVVMVANPPGFYLASGNPAIAVPDGDTNTLLTVARRYNALYLVLEKGSVPANLMPVYDNPQEQTGLIYLGEIENARIFLIRNL